MAFSGNNHVNSIQNNEKIEIYTWKYFKRYVTGCDMQMTFGIHDSRVWQWEQRMIVSRFQFASHYH